MLHIGLSDPFKSLSLDKLGNTNELGALVPRYRLKFPINQLI